MNKELSSRRAGSHQIVRLLHGDCFKRMLDLDEGSLVAIVCDPPYG